MTRPQVLAICVEVASPDLMEDWLAQGWMPNLARVRAAGGWAPLDTVSDLSSGAIWPSFSTALMPGRHGQAFTHMQLASGSYRIVKKYADDVGPPPFWAQLAPAGLTAAIVDVPQTRPLPGFAGVHVVGWGGEYPAWPRCTAPPELMPEILGRFGSHPLAETRRIAARPETEPARRRLRADLLRGVRAKADLSRLVLERGPFDLFLTVFAEPHWAMHLFWDQLDEGHPLHEAETAKRYAVLFRELLAEIDLLIGELRERFPEADLMVFSLSGMGPNHSGWHLLPQVLARLGMGPPTIGRKGRQVQLGSLASRMLRRIAVQLPPSLLDATKGLVPARFWDRSTRRLVTSAAEWAESSAFCLPNDFSGAIRINLEGREPSGKVPGASYEAVCLEIETALRELVDVPTGRPAVRDVVRSRRAYPGPQVDDLPDLVVLWPGDLPLETVRSPRLGTIALRSPERRSGAHRPSGFLAAAGPHVESGARGSGSIVDLGPTLLRLLGLAVPPGLDGQALTWLLRAGPRRGFAAVG